MLTKILLDGLTESGVSVRTQNYIDDEGVEYAIGTPHRCAYVNSEHGRAEIAAELEEPYLSAVMTVWGAAPTVAEETD